LSDLTWEERQQIKKQKTKITKQLILAECYKIIELLENEAETKPYGYNFYSSSELFSKMRELRRDTINLEKIQKGQAE